MQDGTGGVCGYNNKGTVRDCKNTGSVRGTAPLGGVCGVNNSGIIENCFNEGTVSETVTSAGGSGVCGANLDGGTITNCYYLSNTATYGIGGGTDVSGKAEKMSIEHFESGEVAWLLNGKGLGEQVWGQHLGIDPSPVPGSAYKVIKAAKGDNDTYWATFSNQTNDATLSVPSGRNLYVYNATVSGGKMTLTQRNDQVAKGEGVLLKTNGEYVNAKANETNGLPTVSYNENNLVATPPNA